MESMCFGYVFHTKTKPRRTDRNSSAPKVDLILLKKLLAKLRYSKNVIDKKPAEYAESTS